MVNEHDGKKAVYLAAGKRTPFIRMQKTPNKFSASDLAVYAGRDLLLNLDLNPEAFDEVIIGCVNASERETNIARVISYRLGCGAKVPAYTVQRNCASGLQALDSAYKDIALGRSSLILAGGTEAMSHAPLMFNKKMVIFLAHLNSARTVPDKLKALLKFRPNMLSPVIALLQGLTDHTVGLNMGETAEKVAYKFNISRTQMDEYALNSHRAAKVAQDHGYFDEIAPIIDGDGVLFDSDNGVRADSTLEKLGKLKPVFDKNYGNVTAGNSSQITDGAAMLVLGDKEALSKHNLQPKVRIVGTAWSGVDPRFMGLGPVHSIAKLLKQHDLKFSDIDFIEINEAFAAQVLGCVKAFTDEDYLEQFPELKDLGKIDKHKLNVDGGAIALGHPVGASGARLALHMMNLLERKQAKRGIVSLCIGGGQGGAMLLERV